MIIIINQLSMVECFPFRTNIQQNFLEGRTSILTLFRPGYIFPYHEQLINKHVLIMSIPSFTKIIFYNNYL